MMQEQLSPIPIGYCDAVNATSVEGWAYDPLVPDEPLVMHMLVDGNPAGAVRCNLLRYDVAEAGYAARHVGFYAAIPAELHDGESHVVEFRRVDGTPVALRDASGVRQKWELPVERNVQAPPPQFSVILASLDPIQEHGAYGWAYDRSRPNEPVTLDVFIDDSFYSSVVCDAERVDVLAAGHPASGVGFHVELPSRHFDGETHVVEVRPRKDDPRRFETGHGEGYARQTFNLPAQVVVGQVDGLADGAVRGWVFLHDRAAGTRTGNCQVLVTMQGHPVAQFTASEFRADVATAHGCEPRCGFSFAPPAQLVAGRIVEMHFTVIPGGHVLSGSPVHVNFPSMETVAAIRDLSEATDKIFSELWLLRDRLRRMAPSEAYTVQSYDAWARQYQRALAAAPDQLTDLLPRNMAPPLVSILCPAFRPRLKDFVAAVESVRAQSYANWELIIVDDASRSVELSTCIAHFTKEDSRIKAVTLRKNGGISAATNVAIAEATGAYVALFDHDDLLESRAIEFMVAHALRTGARVLYSDEDKIDDDGLFSEVNFKPDWNYRLLLSQNYVCHLLLVDRAALAAAGPFRTECDGAQDHDIIIRLSEVVPHDKIAHVEEVLYHWRKTPTSTAASGKAKAYTVNAGIRAIQDHLGRKGLAGRVLSPRHITCFEIDWEPVSEPSITIIIPYREHIGMTRACLDALRANTEYQNYRIMLVDNWSTSDEALAFAAEMSAEPNISVLRVEESFNYSRLNNLAAAQCDTDLLLFMNNDVVVSERTWLRAMVGELLADHRVGIVGNKLLYPDGLVQHGGVILGVGGIADHAHKGLTKDDPGYVARAISAQDMTAVTAACMLCRRTVFDAVGGFDAQDLQVAFNDVDLCLKVRKAGFRVIWTPASVAEHRESLSRGSDMRPDQQSRFFHENETMRRRWGEVIENDGFYHRAFSRKSGIFKDLGPASPAEFRACPIVPEEARNLYHQSLDRSATRPTTRKNAIEKTNRERRPERASAELKPQARA